MNDIVLTPTRRAFLAQSAAAVAASLITPAEAVAEGLTDITDTNIYLGHSPFRTFPWATDAEVMSSLRQRRVTQAWAGAFEGLLHRDVARVNAQLVAACKRSEGLLMPVGTVNAALPNWKEDLNRCIETHGMKAVRVHPNYHGYTLQDAAFTELLEAVAEKSILLQIVAQMEDQRTQHPLVQVKAVDLKPLPDLVKRVPEARLMMLNANAPMLSTALAGCHSLWLDYAMIEGVGGLEMLAQTWPLEKLCFGSYAPVFYWEAARLKLQEAGFSPTQVAAVCQQNPKMLAAVT